MSLQHSLLLTGDGAVFAVGRNLDGQLGTGARKEARAPAPVAALADVRVVAVACGGDYSVATAENGTVFAWGNNASGQLGRAPVDEGADGGGAGIGGAKVVVMKTTRRIIRLQNSLQNSCDVPRPVPGVPIRKERESGADGGDRGEGEQGVYLGREDFSTSEEEEEEGGGGGGGGGWSQEAGEAALRCAEAFSDFKATGDDVEQLLHLTLEIFAGRILALEKDSCRKFTKLCLVSDNLKAAAKVLL